MRVDETRGQRGKIQRTRGEVHETDELGKIIATKPATGKQCGELLCEKPEVQYVNAEDTKEDERLAPLCGVAPKDPDILEHHGAYIWREQRHALQGAIQETGRVIEGLAFFLLRAIPGLKADRQRGLPDHTNDLCQSR